MVIGWLKEEFNGDSMGLFMEFSCVAKLVEIRRLLSGLMVDKSK